MLSLLPHKSRCAFSSLKRLCFFLIFSNIISGFETVPSFFWTLTSFKFSRSDRETSIRTTYSTNLVPFWNKLVCCHRTRRLQLAGSFKFLCLAKVRSCRCRCTLGRHGFEILVWTWSFDALHFQRQLTSVKLSSERFFSSFSPKVFDYVFQIFAFNDLAPIGGCVYCSKQFANWQCWLDLETPDCFI